jgi:hypothetical protein
VKKQLSAISLQPSGFASGIELLMLMSAAGRQPPKPDGEILSRHRPTG